MNIMSVATSESRQVDMLLDGFHDCRFFFNLIIETKIFNISARCFMTGASLTQIDLLENTNALNILKYLEIKSEELYEKNNLVCLL